MRGRREFCIGLGATAIAANLLRGVAFAREGTPPGDDASSLRLRYDRPARQWNEAIPLGNGRIGAMVFGDAVTERIQFNEATLWTGNPHDYVNPAAREDLAAVRTLIFEGKVQEAAKLSETMMGNPSRIMAYQPFCDLRIDFFGNPHPETYSCTLDLDDAVATVSTGAAGSDFAPGLSSHREAFLSHPDRVFVSRIRGSGGGGQTARFSLSTPHPMTTTVLSPKGDLCLSGFLAPQTAPDGSWIGDWTGEGLKFAARLRVTAKGGTVRRDGDEIFVANAEEIVILVALATSFVDYDDISGDPLASVASDIAKAAAFDYADLRKRHVEDYGRLFKRVDIRIEGPNKAASIPKRIAGFDADLDPRFLATFYQIGRYLTIASSRPGGQPANLQGIWNENVWPWWGSKWTTNINLQMNYWLTDTGNLSECFEPFLDLLEDLHVTGSRVAKAHYGCRGFVFHHNADIWRAATPVDGFWGLWPVGGAWLVLQALDHLAYSGDADTLQSRLYPILRDACLFFADYLVEIPEGLPFAGCYATNPSSSAENWYVKPDGSRGFLSYMPTMDIQILDELFETFGRVSSDLGRDAGLRHRVAAMRKRLPPMQINPAGEIQEWMQDFGKSEAEHRHISHLYALYPGTGIDRHRTPALFRAARATLEARGNGDGGSWPQAIRALCWARLGDGNRASKLLGRMIAINTTQSMMNDGYDQIDGHLGGPAAIAEMLMQSHTGVIVLLPALPDAWASGHIKGLRARGGVVLDFSWENGALRDLTVKASGRDAISLHYQGRKLSLKPTPGGTYRLDGQLVMQSGQRSR